VGREDVRRHPILEALPAQLVDISLIEGDLVAASDAMERVFVAPLHPLVGDLLLSGARAWLAFLRAANWYWALREADLVDQALPTNSAPLSTRWSDSRRHGSRRLALEHGELTVAEGCLAAADSALLDLSGPRPLECYVLWWQARS